MSLCSNSSKRAESSSFYYDMNINNFMPYTMTTNEKERGGSCAMEEQEEF